jgi:hypothetical protein
MSSHHLTVFVLVQHIAPDHNNTNGRPNKQRNGRPKLSDVSLDKDEGYRETDSETPSTTHSREHDSDELSRSPIPPAKSTKGDYNKISLKDNSSQAISISKSHNIANHRIESNGAKGRNCVGGISVELGQKLSDDGKTSVSSDQKQPATSSKTTGLLSKKVSSHVSVPGPPSSIRLHKSMKMEANRAKDKTE